MLRYAYMYAHHYHNIFSFINILINSITISKFTYVSPLGANASSVLRGDFCSNEDNYLIIFMLGYILVA